MSNLQSIFGTTRPVALVTGSGAPRIGNTIARELAQRGFRLAIHFHTADENAAKTIAELESQGCEAASFAADLAQPSQVTRLLDEVSGTWSRLDVVVNSAAVWVPRSLEETTADDVREHWELNCLASFLICQQAGLRMAKQESGGVIINVGDWATVRPYLNYSAYFASKGPIPTMTRMMAVELAERNPRVRVNAVLPGPVMVPDSIVGDERQAIIDGTLLKREGRPENVAHAVRFLIENDFVTGVCVPVDGGRRLA